MMEGWLERLKSEADEMAKRAGRLQAFLQTEEFDQLPETDQGLLWAQFGGMTSLMSILALRIRRGNGEIKDA